MPHSTTVIYHKADYDGIFCKEIARKALPHARFLGWDYGDAEPIVSSDDLLYMLDISVASLMTHPNLRWIDHHKSAIEKYSGSESVLIMGHRIDGVAACRLTWQWFFGQKHTKQEFFEQKVDEPWSVRLAGEYDVWDHEKSEFDDVRFQFGLDSQVKLDWDLLLDTTCRGSSEVHRIIADGRIAQQCYIKRDADVVRDRSFLVTWEGLKFLALNTPRCNSNTFAIWDNQETGHDALMAFFWNGTHWKFSLYHAAHRKELDLSLLAVKYGGGGHSGACGFQVKEFPL